MLEIDEEERADFSSLKIAMPDYKEIRDFFEKMRNDMLDLEGEGSFNNFSEDANEFHFAPNGQYDMSEGHHAQ